MPSRSIGIPHCPTSPVTSGKPHPCSRLLREIGIQEKYLRFWLLIYKLEVKCLYGCTHFIQMCVFRVDVNGLYEYMFYMVYML